jgi:CubicO group peptidase (beta-lactamase class C family)
VATPASVGINAAVLDSIDREIKAGTYNSIDRFVVIRNGRLVYDKHYAWNYDSIYGDSSKTRNPLNAHDPTGSYNYFNPWWHPTYRRGDLHSLQSVTKTVTSVIIGVARTRGDFPSIDTPVLRFFDTTQVKNIDDRKRRMTVRHLLTMSGGIDWNESLPYIDPGNTAVAMEASFDWVEYTINRPMAVEPGSRWLYSSGETELLAHIFRKATGMDIEEYGAKYLFAPLGIERWYWKRIPTGLIDTEGGLYLEAKDLARIWNLWLQNGKVGGKQLISPEWIAESVKPALRVAPQCGRSELRFQVVAVPEPHRHHPLHVGRVGLRRAAPGGDSRRRTWSWSSTAGTSCRVVAAFRSPRRWRGYFAPRSKGPVGAGPCPARTWLAQRAGHGPAPTAPSPRPSCSPRGPPRFHCLRPAATRPAPMR